MENLQAKLHIPAFTRGKSQLSAVEMEETRTIANARIHIERVIKAKIFTKYVAYSLPSYSEG